MNLLICEIEELVALRILYFELCINPLGINWVRCDMKYLQRMEKRLQALEEKFYND